MDLGMHWTIGRAKEHLENEGMSIPAQTLRNWFNELHDSKIHTLKRNERGERVLDETDIAIAKFIYESREKNLTVKSLVPFIQQAFPVQYVDENNEQKLSVYLDQQVILEQLGQMVQERLNQFKHEFEEQQKKMLPAPNQVMIEQRSAAVDVRLAEINMRKRLKEKAEAEWAKNPTKKWFREDKQRKSQFIDEYIESNLEEELLKYKSEMINALEERN